MSFLTGVSDVGGWVFAMGMSSYRWTVEEATDLAASMLQFNIEADAEMAARGYRPGVGLPFEGMPAELFPHDLDLDDPRWVDEDDHPGDPGAPDYPGRVGPGLDASRGYPYGVAAGPGGPGEAVGRVIDALERVEQGIAGLMGDRVVLFEQARALGETGDERTRAGSRQLALRSLRAELGAALRIPERTIDALLGASHSLVHELPATLEALRGGSISYRHAQVMVDQIAGLPAAARELLEGQALPCARRLTVSKFSRKARILRELLDPDSITERHARAREDREVRLDPQQDGLALLSQLLPAAEAVAIFTRLTDAAIALHGPSEVRTLAQLRADIFSEVMLDATTTAAGDDPGDHTDTGSGSGDGSVDMVSLRTRRATARRSRAVRVALTRAGGRVGWERSGIRGRESLRERYFDTRPRVSDGLCKGFTGQFRRS